MSQNGNQNFPEVTRSGEYETIDPSLLVEEEEEMVRGYRAEHYYPVNIGDIFQDRYSVIGKLGYGSASTVWLYIYIYITRVCRAQGLHQHLQSTS